MSAVDRISPLLERFRVRTRLFHAGPLCGVTTFAAVPGRGFLHVLRRGEMTVTHIGAHGDAEHHTIDRPSLLLYPRPLEHAFHNAPVDGSDFACATLDFAGGPTHPLVRALPAVIILPIDDVPPLGLTLDLLFAEIDNVRCGRRMIADRLFEVVLVQLFRWMLDHTSELGLPPGLLSGLADERLAPTIVAIHEEPGQEWSLATMARHAAMSRSSFAAHFKEVVGQPPAEYVTDWRLTVAQDLLLRGTPVATTAIELGYSSASAFSRTFTQRMGRSPRQWVATVGTENAPTTW